MIATAREMPTPNPDVQSMTSLDGTTLAEPTPSGFISVGAASITTTLGAAARALEEMDERQLATQVCFKLVTRREVW
jgi:hypothetical protein